jgi:hypothetical protein
MHALHHVRCGQAGQAAHACSSFRRLSCCGHRQKNNVQTRGGMNASALMVEFAVVNVEFRSISSDS